MGAASAGVDAEESTVTTLRAARDIKRSTAFPQAPLVFSFQQDYIRQTFAKQKVNKKSKNTHDKSGAPFTVCF
jgi:hypothetical protein